MTGLKAQALIINLHSERIKVLQSLFFRADDGKMLDMRLV